MVICLKASADFSTCGEWFCLTCHSNLHDFKHSAQRKFQALSPFQKSGTPALHRKECHHQQEFSLDEFAFHDKMCSALLFFPGSSYLPSLSSGVTEAHSREWLELRLEVLLLLWLGNYLTVAYGRAEPHHCKENEGLWFQKEFLLSEGPRVPVVQIFNPPCSQIYPD